MTGRTLIKRSLRYHWRAHLGVVLGAAVATAVLVGALAVGDSVRYSLRQMALERLGDTQVALGPTDRVFTETPPSRVDLLGNQKEYRDVACALQVRGTAARQDGTARVGGVQVVGFSSEFFGILVPGGSLIPPVRGGAGPHLELSNGVAINEAVARALHLKVGDEFVLHVQKPGALPLDAPMADANTSVVSLPVTVEAILTGSQGGRYSLVAGQVPPANVFIRNDWLCLQLGLEGKANVILIGAAFPTDAPRDGIAGRLAPYAEDIDWLRPLFWTLDDANPPVLVKDADRYFAPLWTLQDFQLSLSDTGGRPPCELTSERIFLDPPLAGAVVKVDSGAVGLLTYFVNELKVGGRSTPYSMATAVGPLGAERKGAAPVSGLLETGAAPLQTTGTAPISQQREKGTVPSSSLQPQASSLLGLLPPDMKDDQIVINSWLAEDLAAKVGDEMEMSYYVIGPGNRLLTRTSRFRICRVVPLEGAAADPSLMPAFPGLAEAESSRQWRSSIPIDLKKIRDKDDAYWKAHRGTPKAFITLAAGQKMWGNRFGDLTAVRWPAIEQQPNRDPYLVIRNALLNHLNPADFGLYFRPVREQALAAVEQGQGADFGWLFVGLSLFLVVAALVLTGLLFALSVEQRTAEVGTLLALGLRPRRVRRLLLAEGAILAIVGGLVGAAAGLAYTRALLYGLATVWQGAVGSADIRFYADPVSVAGGTAAGFIVALAAVWLSVRRQARAPARELLAAGAEAELRMALPRRARPWVGAALAAVGIVGAVAILALPNKPHGEEAAGLFFGAGALLLVAGLGICQTILARMAPAGRKAHARFSGLAVRNATRRRGRSLATIALLACGVFMIITVAAFRKDPLHEAAARSSGTGGFALYGETTMPITQDLNSGAGLQAYALPEDFLGKVAFVPMRVHEGDEASCLNLNRPQTPRLWGVDPQLLASRGAFTFVDTIHPATGSPWALLDEPLPDGAVPAIVDQTTLTWALGKSVGDTIPYTDEQGRTFEIQIVAALENSILQGGLVISEQNLLEKFPSTSGYRAMLVDAPPDEAAKVSADLSEQLSDVGLSLVPAAERLAAFNTVENTYLAIFQALGGLALALGSIGLGVVVLRNVLERRSELALLRAVGFPRRKLYWMVLSEHWALLALGLACGVAASLGAVLPLVESLGTQVPYLSLAVMLAAVLAAGLLWTYLATRLALRGPLLEALRSE